MFIFFPFSLFLEEIDIFKQKRSNRMVFFSPLEFLCNFFVFFFCPQVGDFGDTNSWPTPGEIATKDMQVGCCCCYYCVLYFCSLVDVEDTLERLSSVSADYIV